MSLEAKDFKNTGLKNVGQVATTLFTAPITTGRRYIIQSLIVANVAPQDVAYTVHVVDSSKSNEIRNIVKEGGLAQGGSEAIEDKPTLEPGDSIVVASSVAASLDVNFSYVELEIT